MFVYQKKFIRILEAWDGEQPCAEKVDIVRCFQRPRPIPGMVCRETQTVLLDLRKEPQLLLEAMKKETRYEIRRATRKDSLYYEHQRSPDSKAFAEFCDFFDEFASRQSLRRIDRAWLERMARSRALALSTIASQCGAPLIWHAYHLTATRATLLYSASVPREKKETSYCNFLGRANRFHHWQDILTYKNDDRNFYDFGGWYGGNSNSKLLDINRFKESFGGRKVTHYICERPLTIKGKVFLRARGLVLGTAL